MESSLTPQKFMRKVGRFSPRKPDSLFPLTTLFKVLGKEKNLIAVKDNFFDKNSNKPKYLGLKSTKKHFTDYDLKDCAKLFLKKIS